MRHDVWDENIVPIVFLPAGEAGERLLVIAERWVKAWMLSPALWVRVEDTKDIDGQLAKVETGIPPRVSAIVIGRNGSKVVDLFRELGRGEIKTARLTAVRSLEPESNGDRGQNQIVDVISKYLDSSAPMRYTRDNGIEVGTLLKKINLIFAPTERSGAELVDLFEMGWDANVVVAPEDRPTPASFDAFTRYADQDRLDSFVLANIASATGMWAGVNKSVFELTDSRYSQASQNMRVVLQRSFVRGVASDGYVHRIAARVLNEVAKPLSPLHDPIVATFVNDIEVFEAQEIPEAIKESVTQAMGLDSNRLSYNSPLNFTQIEKSQLGIWSQIKHFLKFTWDKILGLPGLILDALTLRFEKKASDLFHSDQGFAEIKTKRGLRRSRMDAKAFNDATWLESEKARLFVEINEPFPPTRKDTFPSLLKGIRQLSFSLLDGSAPPENLPRARNIEGANRIRVIGDTVDLYPVYDVTWMAPEDLPGGNCLPGEEKPNALQWTDNDGAARWINEIDKRIERFTNGQKKIQPRLSELKFGKSNLQQKLVTLDEVIAELEFELDLEKGE
jgi:hypothetical protein